MVKESERADLFFMKCLLLWILETFSHALAFIVAVGSGKRVSSWEEGERKVAPGGHEARAFPARCTWVQCEVRRVTRTGKRQVPRDGTAFIVLHNVYRYIRRRDFGKTATIAEWYSCDSIWWRIFEGNDDALRGRTLPLIPRGVNRSASVLIIWKFKTVLFRVSLNMCQSLSVDLSVIYLSR